MEPEFYYNYVQSSYPLNPILTQLNSADTITRLRISVLIISFYLRLDLHLSGFQNKILVHFSSSMHDTRPFHRIKISSGPVWGKEGWRIRNNNELKKLVKRRIYC
jgi:hypothetical protein